MTPSEWFEWLLSMREQYRNTDHMSDEPVFVAGFDGVDVDYWLDAMRGA